MQRREELASIEHRRKVMRQWVSCREIRSELGLTLSFIAATSPESPRIGQVREPQRTPAKK
ncbi:hypothetical protein ACIHFC_01700 [Streptomyces sp. NPDC052013]|uniref:hypothetical protein n=1 Tax=Streptomyces sp. NPDC052013 TaxID=3365679 RepID=UPI0037D4552A